MNDLLRALLIVVVCGNYCDRLPHNFGLPVCWAAAQYSNDEWLRTMVPSRYKRSEAPTNIVTAGAKNITLPVVVVAYVTPKFVTEISMKNMDFVVDMAILIEWYDSRLQLPTEDIIGDSDNTLPSTIAEKIWYPSIFLDNCKDNGMLVTTPKDGDSGLINVGRLWTKVKEQNFAGMRVNYRKAFRFTCDLDFAAYPFDEQECAIQLTWNYKRSKPVGIQFHTEDHDRPNIRHISVPPGFRLIKFVVGVQDNDTSDLIYITEKRALSFTIQRVYGQYLMLVFFPSMLIVILSWLSFWLDAETAGPRVALGLTSLLTLSTQFGNAQKDLPAVSKIKAMDIWMFTCMFAVFASLVEFGIAYFFRRKKVPPSPKPKIKPLNNYVYTNVVFDKKEPTRRVKTAGEKRPLSGKRRLCRRFCVALRPRATGSRVDHVARILFPMAFLIFNICFWSKFYPTD